MADILTYNALAQANFNLINATPTNQAGTEDGFNSWPSRLTSLRTTNSLCVRDTDTGYFRCGRCCLWTVPAGATRVRFEVWGAGAGSGAGRCCAGSPFGATGAYASTIVSTVAGCQYTLCAGCAHCCQLYCTGCFDVSGCQSFVNGFGLTGFCADGGCSNIIRSMTILHGTECCRYQARCSTTAGACICGAGFGNFFCYSGSCQISCCATFCGITRFYDPDRRGRGFSNFSIVQQIPSMYPADWFDTNFYGCTCAQPTILPGNCINTVTSICCLSYSSGTCCGASYGGACTGNRCQPGQGGSWTHIMGGNTEQYGDWGRTGMVKVSWC